MRLPAKLAVVGLVAALGLGFALAVPAEETKPAVCFDKARCAELMGHGREAFNRGKFSEAKRFFREAVKSDPSSAKAWAFYDLSVMYDVADQVKRAGSVKVSGAPLLGPAAAAPTAGAAKPSTAPPPPPPKKPTTGAIIIDDEGC